MIVCHVQVPKTHTLHDDNVEQNGENSRSSNDEDGNHSQGRPRTPRYAFSSEEHPQFCSHDIKLRSSPTIPVIIGDGLPKRDNTAHKDEQFCRYLLLLLKPWRSFNDLSRLGQTWHEVFEHTEFSPYCQEIMANMVVDTECRNAKAEHRTLLLSELPLGNDRENGEEQIEVDGNLLTALIADDESLNDARELTELADSDIVLDERDISVTLADDEAEVFCMAR